MFSLFLIPRASRSTYSTTSPRWVFQLLLFSSALGASSKVNVSTRAAPCMVDIRLSTNGTTRGSGFSPPCRATSSSWTLSAKEAAQPGGARTAATHRPRSLACISRSVRVKSESWGIWNRRNSSSGVLATRYSGAPTKPGTVGRLLGVLSLGKW